MNKNYDEKVVADFGHEWSVFDQSDVPEDELHDTFKKYFSIFPFTILTESAEGFDLGCGSGRWARFISPLVGKLHCIDPSSKALDVAHKNLTDSKNCSFYLASVDEIPLMDNSMDFGYSLGVLHHIPDTQKGIDQCVKILKPGAPLLLYLYYAFDNRPFWFKCIWNISDVLRKTVSKLPNKLKYFLCQIIAFVIYFPLAKIALIIEKIGINPSNFPLSTYRNKSLYTMRTDALDRFGTRLEKRFTQKQIMKMMMKAGLDKIIFNNNEPYWCALGYKTII
ncbi:MAG: ubiquinone/menaquinone biosynthesis C-methylase UbiE [Gammaproteobacteria bacterium]